MSSSHHNARITGVGRRRLRSVDIEQNMQARREVERRRDSARMYFVNQLHVQGVQPDPNSRFNFDLDRSAHHGSFLDYSITHPDDDWYGDVLTYLSCLKGSLLDRLRSDWSSLGGIAFTLQVNVNYQSGTDHRIFRNTALYSEYYRVYTARDVIVSIDAALGDIERENQQFNNGRSDWKVFLVSNSVLRVNQIRQSASVVGGGKFLKILYSHRGGKAYIPLPTWVQAKQGCINIKNEDIYCFKYVMECALMLHTSPDADKIKNINRASLYKDRDSFNYGNLIFPIHPLDVELFEKLNSHLNLAINTYCVEEEKGSLAVIDHSDNHSRDAWQVNLLYITNRTDRDEQTDAHWVLIKDMNKLVKGLNGMVKGARRFLCPRCTMDYASQESLEEHQIQCFKEEPKRPLLPRPYEAYKCFSNLHKKRSKPFAIYADFEAFNAVIDHSKDATDSITLKKRQTKQVASGFCFHTVCKDYPQFNHTVLQTYDQSTFNQSFDTDIGTAFILAIELEQARIQAIIAQYFSYPLDNINYQNKHNDKCVFCNLSMTRGFMPHWKYKNFRSPDSFTKMNDEGDEVKDSAAWFQRMRMFKGPLSTSFQQQLLRENMSSMRAWDPTKINKNYIGNCHFACGAGTKGIGRYGKIPVLFHNLSNYDEHLILKSLDPSLFTKKFNGIPLAGDKFMSFSVGDVEFLDSFRFLTSSLESLVNNLKKSGPSVFVNLTNGIRTYCERKGVTYTDDILKLMTQKGEFPYEYFDSPARLEDQALPPRSAFHSKLAGATKEEKYSISEEEYQNAQHVWTTMKCQSLRDYHDLYLLQDTLLLSDVFENFRRLCRSENDLEPLWYPSLPGYSQDSCFLHTKSPRVGELDIPFYLELFPEGSSDMYLFMEESIRGGISMTPGRYAKANHKYLDDYDPNEPSKHILYWDANNLYGYAMSQPLPFGGYEWVTPPSECHEIVQAIKDGIITDDDPHGYMLEVDGYFPDEVHDYLKDFPPAPVKQVVTEDMISPYSQQLNTQFEIKHDNASLKLLCTLNPRVKYKVHHRNLQLYMQLGFIVTDVHRVLRFQQSTWMKSYIDHNTAKRAVATSAFEKDFYKLMNNAAYGKFIQNNRKHSTVIAIDPWKMDLKATWDPFLQDRRIVNETLVLGYLKKGRAECNSPLPVGSVILEHSKWLMYDFFYNTVKRVYEDKARLIFTDTDSLCLEIQTDDVMADLTQHGLDSLMDLSEWPKNTDYYGKEYYNPINKKVIGKFKDEMVTDDQITYITEVVALRSKMYSCLQSNNKNKATAKGITRAAKKGISHKDYMECLFTKDDYEIKRVDMWKINSVDNNLYLNVTSKQTLSPCDSKCYLIDATHTVCYGHYSIRPVNNPVTS